MTSEPTDARLTAVLDTIPRRVVACSGGVDSLLLAHRCHAHDAAATVVAHAVTPAVPPRATARVLDAAARHGWDLRVVTSGEFSDERYLSNPRNRCYVCKSNLYDVLDDVAVAGDDVAAAGADTAAALTPATVLSGANLDDLGEYRPGLTAAAEHEVRHPWVEASVDKSSLRALARDLGLPWADLPAAPCLASRLYTGTRVTPRRLHAVDVGEELLRSTTGVDVVRCRLREDEVLIEVGDDDRSAITPSVVDAVAAAMRRVEPTIAHVALDDAPYAPGRSFLPVA